MNQAKKSENKLITWWKRYFTKFSNGMRKQGSTENEIKDTMKYFADRQLEAIEQASPDKTKKIEDQMNDYQKEYIEYLKKVQETGEI